MNLVFDGVGLVARKTNRGGPREGAGRPKTGRNDIAVKLDRATVARARFVAESLNQSLAEYLTSVVKPTVDRDFHRVSKEQDENKEKGGQ